MTECDAIRERMSLYLDRELQGSERIDFEKHLRQCEQCRRSLQTEGEVIELIRKSPRFYTASSELRGRVEALLNAFASQPFQLEPKAGLSWRKRVAISSWVLGTSSLILFLFFVAVWLVIRERGRPITSGPSEFALMAADTHLRHLRRQLPLEITSEVPQTISSWFSDKLPFSVQLPNYQESSGQEKQYKLEGARLVGYKNDYAAYVAYQMRQRPISLVITSRSVAQPAGGEEIVAKGLTFHYDSINGLKVITWSDRGLTYALVSDLEERGQQSCIVCHHGDPQLIKSLNP